VPAILAGRDVAAAADFVCWKCGKPHGPSQTAFRSAEHDFEVMFHATPDVQEETSPSEPVTWVFTEASGSKLFQVRVTDAPSHFGSAVDFLHKMLTSLAGTIAQPLLTRIWNENRSGLPALRFSFTSAGRQGDGLLVLRGSTLFTVVAIDHSVVGLERDRFVESFRVL
jgi:hypothetical protein